MESEGGQRVTSNPQAALSALLAKRERLQDELRHIEKQVYDLETSYLHESVQCGNVLRGFEGFLSSTRNTTSLKRSRKFQPEDRLFSLSSVTSPVVEEHMGGREGICQQFCLRNQMCIPFTNGRFETGFGRSKATLMPINGQAKQKKGRPTPRDGRRMKQANDQDFDEDDDSEMRLI